MRFLVERSLASSPSPSLEGPYTNVFGLKFDSSVILYLLIVIIMILVGLCVLLRTLILHITGRQLSGITPANTVAGGAASGQEQPVVPAAVVESFPCFVFDPKAAGSGEGEVTCTICLEDYKENDTMRRLPVCGHAFHSECLEPWFKQHTTCPVCRLSLLPKAKEEEGEDGQRTVHTIEGTHEGDVPITVVTVGGGGGAVRGGGGEGEARVASSANGSHVTG